MLEFDDGGSCDVQVLVVALEPCPSPRSLNLFSSSTLMSDLTVYVT
jgi:hypothetical protein